MSDVLTTRIGKAGVITLNRPAALNALTLDMVQALRTALDAFMADDVVQHVVITSSSEKAFCAGGDVRAATAVRDQIELGAAFFRAEYELNYAIAHAPKAVVALVDGLCMGGGLGLSVLASHCVTSERASFAMPEMAIGLFPYVGGGYFLNKCPGDVGLWLALTGARLSGVEAVQARLARYLIPAEKMTELKQALSRMDCDEAIEGLARFVPADQFSAQLPAINDAFSRDSVEGIIRALETQNSEWAQAQLAALQRGSPTSLKATFTHLRRMRGQSLRTVLQAEYRMACACLRGLDFYEGVRAQLIDKDKSPRWQPATLDGVSEAQLAAFVAAPVGADLFVE